MGWSEGQPAWCASRGNGLYKSLKVPENQTCLKNQREVNMTVMDRGRQIMTVTEKTRL